MVCIGNDEVVFNKEGLDRRRMPCSGPCHIAVLCYDSKPWGFIYPDALIISPGLHVSPSVCIVG